MRVVATAAALLGVLALPAPVAAETAEQRQATLNAYRAKAGLAKASSTSIPALGVAAGRHAGYRVNVDPATRSCWVDAPYHRLPLMDATTATSAARPASGWSTAAPTPPRSWRWPPPTPFGGSCDAAHPVQNVGYVVTLQTDGYYALKIQGIGLSRGAPGSPVAIHRAVRYRTTTSTVAALSVDTNLPANAAMLAATAPLAPRTTYNVRVSGYVQAAKGGKWVQFKTRTWSFTTA